MTTAERPDSWQGGSASWMYGAGGVTDALDEAIAQHSLQDATRHAVLCCIGARKDSGQTGIHWWITSAVPNPIQPCHRCIGSSTAVFRSRQLKAMVGAR